MDLITKIKGLSYLGFKTLWRSLTYALKRDFLERRQGLRRCPPKAVSIGQIREMKKVAGGATFVFEAAELEVIFLCQDLVRITFTPGDLPVPYALDRTDWTLVEPDIKEDELGWAFSTKDLSLTIHRDGSMNLYDAQGQLLRSLLPPMRRGEGWVHCTRLMPDERCHGLGLRSAPFDIRGRDFRLWNLEAKGSYGPNDDPLYLSVPVWLGIHSKGCVLTFYESSWHGHASFHDEARFDFDGGALRLYLIPGPPAQAMERYALLTGLPAMPPRWALGYHQSRWSYMNEHEVHEVAKGFRERGLPLSAIHLDIHYMDGHRVFTIDKQRFPDLRRLCQELEDVKVVTILDPGVKYDDKYEVFVSGRDGGYFLKWPDGRLVLGEVWPGTSAFPDFTNPKTRKWWGGLYRILCDAGVAGFWHDMNEPAAFAAFGDCTLPVMAPHYMEGRGGDHREAHNVYALLEARAAFEGLRELNPDKRPWILSRSGFAGLQRYAWNWTGDSESNWWSLRQSLRIALSLSVCGIPYTGPDIGGFGGAPSPELFARWFELGAFLPFFRTHSAWFTPRREPWCFDDKTYAIIAKYLKLRARLMPYWYTLAFEASRLGHPLVRPMFWPDASDKAMLGLEDQFYIGDALLVAPILEEGVNSREVLLPKGLWYNLYDDQMAEGPGKVHVEAPIETIPVFVRAGSIVPMEEDGRIVLHVYVPPAPFEVFAGELYSDAGDGYGEWRLDRFWLRRDENIMEIVRQGEGTYPCPRFAFILHGARLQNPVESEAGTFTRLSLFIQ